MKKILVIDDSGVQRKMIIQIIRKAGYEHEVLEAADGAIAIEILAANYADIGLCLCDWNMPNMSGLEFIEGVAQVPTVSNIPIVMVTTEGTEEKIAQAKAANPNLSGYVKKPFTPEHLKDAIGPIINSM